MPFDTSDRTALHDLVFRYVMRREYPDPKNPGQWKLSEKPGNAYFHARDLACLHRVQELSNINETHIYQGWYISQSDGRPLGVTRV